MSKEQRRNANKLTNLLETAKKYNKNRNIFLFIKWNIIQEMKKNIDLTKEDRNKFNVAAGLAEGEMKVYNWSVEKMVPKEYDDFLEYYYKTINFKAANLDLLYKCKDLLDISPVKNDLYNKRIDYFVKRIGLLEKKQIENQGNGNVREHNQNMNVNDSKVKDNNDRLNNNCSNKSGNILNNKNSNNSNNILTFDNYVNNNKNDAFNKRTLFKSVMVPSVINRNNIALNKQNENKMNKDFYMEKIKNDLINQLISARNDISNDKIENTKNYIERVLIKLREITKSS